MKKTGLTARMLNLTLRSGLFALTLSLGTLAALLVGETRGLALTNLADASVQAVVAAARGDVLYAGLAGGPQPTGIYRSEDNGRSWEIVGPGPGMAVNALAVHPANNSVLYAGTSGGSPDTVDSLWISDNGGQTWRRFNLRLPASASGLIPGVTALAVDPNHPGVLYVGTDGHGVYRFTATPDSYGYELLGGVALYNAHVKGLVVSPDSRLYALTSDGLFVAKGNAWRKLETLPELAIDLAVASDDPQTLYAGTASTGVYKSTDGGQTWARLGNGLDLIPGAALRVTALAVDEQNPARLAATVAYGLGSRLSPDGIYESRDSGQHWAKLIELDSVATHVVIDRGVIYAATANGLVRHGESTAPARAVSVSAFQTLRHPTGLQVLILSLTLALAGLMLVGRTEWLLGRRAATI